MCLCEQGPVFTKPHGWPSPLLTDVFGEQLSDQIRLAFGVAVPDRGPYGYVICGCGDGYLAASLSSVWVLVVMLLAFAGGVTFRRHRHVALGMLGSAVMVSLIDTGWRFASIGSRSPEKAEAMARFLPAQLTANLLFQITAPAAVALVVAFAARKGRDALLIVRRSRRSSAR